MGLTFANRRIVTNPPGLEWPYHFAISLKIQLKLWRNFPNHRAMANTARSPAAPLAHAARRWRPRLARPSCSMGFCGIVYRYRPYALRNNRDKNVKNRLRFYFTFRLHQASISR
jgi:hypothetical protein